MTRSPTDWFKTTTNKKDHWEATKWCEDMFGPRWEVIGNRQGRWCVFWTGRSVPGTYEWSFEREQDFLLFALKWKS